MAETVVLMASGTDRPGVMDELAEFILECGGNITDSRSVNLHGIFSLLLLVHGEPSAIQTMRQRAAKLTDAGIRAEIHQSRAGEIAERTTFPHVFIARGKDQAGVLHRISHLLTALKINIEDLQTHVSADGSFQIRLLLAVPRETPVTMLREYLRYLCAEIGIEWELSQA